MGVNGKVAASTQNQALQALVVLCGQFLERPLPAGAIKAVRTKRPLRLPTVLTKIEVSGFFQKITGVFKLVAWLQYGAGLRLMGALRLRTKDIDFDRKRIPVRHGKGGKDRMVPLQVRVIDSLMVLMRDLWHTHRQDLQQGHGAVSLPDVLIRRAKITTLLRHCTKLEMSCAIPWVNVLRVIAFIAHAPSIFRCRLCCYIFSVGWLWRSVGGSSSGSGVAGG